MKFFKVDMDIEDGRRIKFDEERLKNDDYAFSKRQKMIFCFLGLQLSYVAWGVAQENLMTQSYQAGKFKSSVFCVFGNRFFAMIISVVIVWIKRFSSNQPVTTIPFYYYFPSSLSNSVSTWAQYEALKYISFPSQVLSKSCKIIPVMLVS